MSTPPKPAYLIKAQYLGPIFELDGALTKRDQNLIFARNGTGKSFLSRTLRYLDRYGQNRDTSNAPRDLVSDESPNGIGNFSLIRGENTKGQIKLNKPDSQVSASISETIFHVFSEDYVQEELREREYLIDGEITNTISVDSNNIDTENAKNDIEKAEKDEFNKSISLNVKFESEKESELVKKSGIRKQLGEYKNLNLDDSIKHHEKIPSQPAPSLHSIITDLDKIKSIPSEPDYPATANQFDNSNLVLAEISTSLTKITSPSSVSEKIKSRIDSHRKFYEEGLAIIEKSDHDQCPICEQNITTPSPKAVIDAYVNYFADEEAKHKSELRLHYKSILEKEREIEKFEHHFNAQKSLFDDLKQFLPSQKDKKLENIDHNIETIKTLFSDLKNIIEKKSKSLQDSYHFYHDDIYDEFEKINKIINENNQTISVLNQSILKSNDERKELQRNACLTFAIEFIIRNWSEIQKLSEIRQNILDLKNKLAELEKSAPTTDARSRVAETFEALIKIFFADRYKFDRGTFTLTRGDFEMSRGAHRTLSDGEKTAIAFCYFIASIHKKMKSNSDYSQIFLVFDDPVTSMSYDFIFTIAQTLKSIAISPDGDISFNLGLISNGKYHRPELLILTHSSYFFNICVSNKIVARDASFALQKNNDGHSLTTLNKYVAPFQDQLKDIYEIANGRNPDHTTANAIRSVLEAIGRFCRPDADDLQIFIQHLGEKDGILIKSTLINSLSHGSPYEEIPSPEDLTLACAEAITVVEKYAAGQIEILKSSR